MLLGLWKKKGGWTRLELPSVAVVVFSKYRSRSGRVWGAAPVDGRSPTASSYPLGQVSTSTPIKGIARWDSSSSGDLRLLLRR
ncbi:hypothetical protein C2845_PM10G11560 [Panicum miliaceum]|uniref:Uncharacterized protein n=1 Tax=Panicum miliaceum TaxID=4540 RepID=A0A3L6PA48_PANMI|nr:hypothetical protein C2845_PM10G11560 [Panicum miliaceum]